MGFECQKLGNDLTFEDFLKFKYNTSPELIINANYEEKRIQFVDKSPLTEIELLEKWKLQEIRFGKAARGWAYAKYLMFLKEEQNKNELNKQKQIKTNSFLNDFITELFTLEVRVENGYYDLEVYNQSIGDYENRLKNLEIKARHEIINLSNEQIKKQIIALESHKKDLERCIDNYLKLTENKQWHKVGNELFTFFTIIPESKPFAKVNDEFLMNFSDAVTNKQAYLNGFIDNVKDVLIAEKETKTENKIELQNIFKSKKEWLICKELMEELDITLNEVCILPKGKMGKLSGLIITLIDNKAIMLKVEVITESNLLNFFNQYLNTNYKSISKRNEDFIASLDTAKRLLKQRIK